MKIDELNKLFKEHGTDKLQWEGTCHVCETDVVITAIKEDDALTIAGGGLYHPAEEDYFLKCDECFKKDQTLRNYRQVETYSRVVGYLRPVSNWNKGKQAEFNERVTFKFK